jgi:hypothetical protein
MFLRSTASIRFRRQAIEGRRGFENRSEAVERDKVGRAKNLDAPESEATLDK